MSTNNSNSHAAGCCSCHPVTGTVVQTLSEMDFERGIWNAAIYNEVNRIKYFIQNGQTDQRDNGGYTALHYASRNGNEEICKLLLLANADVNAMTNGGATPLHRAAMMGHLNVVRLLINFNAKLDLIDQDGQTALHRSASRKHLLVSKELINKCKNLKLITNNKGHTPYDLVPDDSNNKELKILLKTD